MAAVAAEQALVLPAASLPPLPTRASTQLPGGGGRVASGSAGSTSTLSSAAIIGLALAALGVLVVGSVLVAWRLQQPEWHQLKMQQRQQQLQLQLQPPPPATIVAANPLQVLPSVHTRPGGLKARPTVALGPGPHSDTPSLAGHTLALPAQDTSGAEPQDATSVVWGVELTPRGRLTRPRLVK